MSDQQKTEGSSDRPRILLVRLSALGDCLHAVPVVEELRRQLPDAHIGWLIQGPGLALLSDHRGVDRFHIFDRKARGLASLRSLRALRRELHEEKYDIALDLQGLTKSGVLARLSGARRVMGFGEPESRELNRLFVGARVAVSQTVEHVVDRNLYLLRALDLVPESNSAPVATWHLPEIDLAGKAIGDLLESVPDQKPVAVLNPGTTWLTKIWAQERFADVAQKFVDRGLSVVVTWAGEEEEAMADRIVNLSARERDVHKAPSTSLMELRGLLQRAAILVANDSGPLHLAVAVGVPSVGIYGPTDPARNGPYGWNDPDWRSAAVTLADLEPTAIAAATNGAAQSEVETVGAGRLLSCQFCWKAACRRGDGACLAHLNSTTVVDLALDLLD